MWAEDKYDASKSEWCEKSKVLKRVLEDGENLQHASQHLRNDLDVVLAAVRQNGVSLEYASPSLKDEYDVALLAVKTNGT